MSKPIPKKTYWMGEDIETLSREKLIELVHELAGDLQQTRDDVITAIRMGRLLNYRRADGQSEHGK